MKACQVYDKQSTASVERFDDGYATANLLERVPFVLAGARRAVIDQQADARLAAEMKAFDFHKVDNSIVSRLVLEGFFETLFGPAIEAEQTRQAGLAYE